MCRTQRTLQVNLIHPDLGLGGAERLIIDIATATVVAGHKVSVYTAHHDKSRCFSDTLTEDGGRVHWIHLHATWLPRNILGRFHAICANFRCLWLVIVALWKDYGSVDVWILDQVPLPIVVLNFFAQKTIFYCHFPDCLLAPHNSVVQKLYRAPVDYIEEMCIGMANSVVVNSSYTEDIFAKTFVRLYAKGICPRVLYPTSTMEQSTTSDDRSILWFRSKLQRSLRTNSPGRIFLSINRFDSKKNIKLAVLAFFEYSQSNEDCEDDVLIVAGGYDPRIRDNVKVLSELQKLAQELHLNDRVVFLSSINNEQKNALLSNCTCLLYTPEREHFGIVPLEAMQYQKPVIACRNGGPMETIIHGATGFLCRSCPREFALAMSAVVASAEERKRMGNFARKYFEHNFGPAIFNERVHNLIKEVLR